jgi:hypothetical protein
MALLRAMVMSQASTEPRDGAYSPARLQASTKASWRISSASAVSRSIRSRRA